MPRLAFSRYSLVELQVATIAVKGEGGGDGVSDVGTKENLDKTVEQPVTWRDLKTSSR